MVVNCANSPSTKFVPRFWWVNFFISLLNILCLKVWNIKPIGDIKVAVLIFLYTVCEILYMTFFPLGE